ncbi:hypothetical protein DM01DRAFT_1340620 [Hesseltinella vesiculosa]|uniref:RING-type domain-containing protein n=1 Tax=Hesseltinella vesiculosa TaxID=101127 RepID=A0A1X2G4N7_9FUNG|nr:hypothetical protein DM01DRAFT_1340620 [Hesseltinella vesiculosa]
MTSATLFMALPKIALIIDGKCSLSDKLWFAQMDGANACIVYASDNASFTVPPLPSNASLTLPTFYVPNSVGQQLLSQIQHFQQLAETVVSSGSANVTAKQVVRVLLLPASAGQPNPWEITLLIMIVILSIGFFASVSMYVFLWRRNKRLRRLVDQGVIPAPPSMLPMGKVLLKEQKLDMFPTMTVTQEHLDQRITGDESDYDCVICLEPMAAGQNVRQLPCHHDYHCACIDPWLTTKSGECPLCKFDCMKHVMTEEELQAMERAIALFEGADPNVWHWIKRHLWKHRSPPSSSESVQV